MKYDIVKEMPDLCYFKVGTASGKKFLFCSRESSLGLFAISGCGIYSTNSIKPVDKNFVRNIFNPKCIYFAETGRPYDVCVSKGFNDLKKDYLITKIAGVTQ